MLDRVLYIQYVVCTAICRKNTYLHTSMGNTCDLENHHLQRRKTTQASLCLINCLRTSGVTVSFQQDVLV